MAIPDVSFTINDNALGISPPNSNNIPLLLGISQSGTVHTLYAFSDIPTLYSTLGDGPLTEAAALVLSTAGGSVLCMPITIGTAGAESAVTHAGTGTAVFAVAGAAYDSYSAIIKIVTAGANLAAATAQFKVSVDGGKTYSATTNVPTGGSYAIPHTNITATITDGTFVVDDTYSFTSTAPIYTANEFATGLTAALADSREWFAVHAVGLQASLADAESLVGGMDTALATAATAYRFAMGVVEFPSGTDSQLLAAATGSSLRVSRAAGFENTTSPISGRQVSRSVGWAYTARLSAINPSEDVGRVPSGPLSGVTAVSRDERVTPNLDAKFTTSRTIIGQPGFFLTTGRIAAPNTSDFQLAQYRRVMDLACRTTYQALLTFLNTSVRVDSNGKILEVDARNVEHFCNQKLAAALLAPQTKDGQGYASSVSTQVDRSGNILSTQILPVTIRITPRGYARSITVSIGFANPALQITPTP